MAEFTYKNTKNSSTSYTSFELNYGYYPCIFFDYKVDLCSKSHTVNKPAKTARELKSIGWENLFHAHKLQN